MWVRKGWESRGLKEYKHLVRKAEVKGIESVSDGD